MGALAVDDIDVAFDGRTVLDGVSLLVPSGELIALLGPSGSGKSTLLKVMAGIVEPDSGRVGVDGVDVTAVPTHLRRIGMVFQANQLFTHRNVIDNVAFGLRMKGIDRRTRNAAADGWLDRVGLPGFGARSVTELSGGEAKRVALARTLITDPVVVLLDEPLSGLDRELHDRLAADLREILRDAGTTAVLVTHDPQEAAMVADRSVELAELSGARHDRGTDGSEQRDG
jgi:thiamine transport system ATP-binding protein